MSNNVHPKGISLQQWNAVKTLQSHIFCSYLNVDYQQHYIDVAQNQSMYTVFIRSKVNTTRTFFISHGFGGTSLMFFPCIKTILNYGNIILWDIRGMGLSSKRRTYPSVDVLQFFIGPINSLLSYYQKFDQVSKKPKIFVGHSFGAYLIFMFAVKPHLMVHNIKQYILLSPCGITPKENDYKNKINSLTDLKLYITSNLCWKLGITYKSPLRWLLCCLKSKILSKVIEILINFPDGSQSIFFQLFQPRVIPKQPVEPEVYKMKSIPTIHVIFGGDQDWMDKVGARRLHQKYPSTVIMHNLEHCGHNIPFHVQACQSIFIKLYRQNSQFDENQQNNNNSLELLK